MVKNYIRRTIKTSFGVALIAIFSLISCVDKAEDIQETLNLDKSILVLTKEKQVEHVSITSGSGKYELDYVNYAQFIKAELKGNKIIITGVKAGEGRVIVKDLTTGKTKVITVTVKSVSTDDISLSKYPEAILVKDSFNVDIMSGSGKYELDYVNYAQFIKAELKGNKIIITGVKAGEGRVIVKDLTTGKTKVIIVTVKNIPTNDISLSIYSETIDVQDSFNLDIISGSGKYELDYVNYAQFIKAELKGNKIIITGVKAGEGRVIVKDLTTGKTKVIIVTVK